MAIPKTTASGVWLPEAFESSLEGVSSAVSPELLGPYQLAWALNTSCRGGKPFTRAPFRYRMTLPSGLVQGAGYFGIQNGMGVCAIGGRLYRLRILPRSFAWEEITLPWRNSALLTQVWMCQTVGSLVVQDFQSDPVIYDGSTARRSDVWGLNGDPEVPRGRQMAYGNGRLWVAVNDKTLVAGDITQSIPGSELKFTETNYLSGGGDLSFSQPINGLSFIPTNGSADYGPLLVLGPYSAESVRADITSRDQWGQPGFVTNVLRSTGTASHWSLCPVNQDVYWRDSDGGLRSIYSSGSDEASAGSSPISREVCRLTDYDSRQLLGYCSAIYFDNRLLVTASPFLNEVGGVSWRHLIPLDFSPVSTMAGKTAPAYEGQWSGLNVTHLFTGQFSGRPRAFAISHNPDGSNALWEIMADQDTHLGDETSRCESGGNTLEPNPTQAFVEYGRRAYGDPKRRKRLERLDVYLSELSGDVTMQAWWRADNRQKWTQWDEVEVCAQVTDPATTTPHAWQNLLPQQRPQVKSFTVPAGTDAITSFALQTGFEFQVRLSWVGEVKLYKSVLWSSFLGDTPFADRNLVSDACLLNDVSGNQIDYVIPISLAGDPPVVTGQPQPVSVTPGDSATFTVAATGTPILTYRWQESRDDGATWNNLFDGGIYSGTGTASLVLGSVPYSYNGYLYRCILNNGWTPAGCAGTGPDSGTDVASGSAPLSASFLGVSYAGNSGGADGAFQWHGFTPFGWSDNGRIPAYYLTDTGSGFASRQDFGQALYPPGGAAVGSISAQDLGGALLYDWQTGVLTGNFAAILLSTGNFCNGSSWRGSYGGYTGDVSNTVSAQNFASLLPFYNEVVETPISRSYATTDYPTGGGYLETYCGNAMWGNPGDSAQEILSEQMTLEQAAANGGSVEIPFTGSSRVTSFNSSTGATVGLLSRVEVTRDVPSSTGWMLGLFSYLQTPLAGGPDSTFTEGVAYAVGIGGTLATTHMLPMIAGYTVTLNGLSILDFGDNADDFSDTGPGWVRIVNGGSGWAGYGTFGMPQPGGSYDSFDQESVGVVATILGGDNWAGPGTFGQSDYTEASDDWSNYPAGAIYFAWAGLGWAGSGTFGWNDYPQSTDDLSGFAPGAYDVLLNSGVVWVSDGTFGLNDYLIASDDFGSYPVGTYNSLNGGLNWASDGTFG